MGSRVPWRDSRKDKFLRSLFRLGGVFHWQTLAIQMLASLWQTRPYSVQTVAAREWWFIGVGVHVVALVGVAADVVVRPLWQALAMS